MDGLSVELRYLLYVAILSLLLWVPYILAHIGQVGPVRALGYRESDAMPEWARRLKGAHRNMVENIAPFAVAVLAGEIINVHTGLTAVCAAVFFWARLLHPVAMVANIWGTRTLCFAVGWTAAIVYLFALLFAGSASAQQAGANGAPPPVVLAARTADGQASPACATAMGATALPRACAQAGVKVARGNECPAGSGSYCSDELPYCCGTPGNYYCAKDVNGCTR